MIIELCGIPGAGKTTLVNSVKCIVPSFCDRTEFLNQRTMLSIVYKKLLYFSYFKIPVLKSARIIRRFVSQYPLADEKYIIRLLDMFVAYRCSNKKTVFLDEGAVQYISSISFRESLQLNDELVAIVHAFYASKKALVAYVEQSTGIAMSRIRSRNFTYDRYNVDTEEEMELLLKKKEDSLKTLLKILTGTNSVTMIEQANNEQLLSRISSLLSLSKDAKLI